MSYEQKDIEQDPYVRDGAKRDTYNPFWQSLLCHAKQKERHVYPVEKD